MLCQSYTMWNTFEFTAKLNGCSCSRLAINGGLNATTFNRCKRITESGDHFLSFGTIIKTLRGSNMNLVEFSVIYEVLDTYPNFNNTDKMREILTDMNTHLRHHIENLRQIQNLE